MLIVNNVLVSDDVLEKHFSCNLDACKGACCWEGDWGAPLESQELDILDQIFDQIKPFLSNEGLKAIRKQGKYTYYEEPDEYGTPLLKNGACAYLTKNEQGIYQCGIEQAYLAGATDYHKPISCHLYPIRVESKPEHHFEALNYDKWSICSAACKKGKKEDIRVFEFAKDALIRKYGEQFYEELEAAARHMEQV